MVQKVRPLEPKRFDGVQDLEIVTRFLYEVEHYVFQGGAVCAKASKDNQHIDTAWRFLSMRAFQWFENAMTKLGVCSIPPDNYEYGITLEQVREAFKKQYVPELEGLSRSRARTHYGRSIFRSYQKLLPTTFPSRLVS